MIIKLVCIALMIYIFFACHNAIYKMEWTVVKRIGDKRFFYFQNLIRW
jgi:hypothetical protein